VSAIENLYGDITTKRQHKRQELQLKQRHMQTVSIRELASIVQHNSRPFSSTIQGSYLSIYCTKKFFSQQKTFQPLKTYVHDNQLPNAVSVNFLSTSIVRLIGS